MITEISVIIIDSPQNCLKSENLFAPNTFLTPTSFDLRRDLAVDKFTKLKQAISKTRNIFKR